MERHRNLLGLCKAARYQMISGTENWQGSTSSDRPAAQSRSSGKKYEIELAEIEVAENVGDLSLDFKISEDDLKASLYNPLGEEVWIATTPSADRPASTGVQFPMPGLWTMEVLGSAVKSSGRYTGWVEILDGPPSQIPRKTAPI